jgi:hypothetical protein
MMNSATPARKLASGWRSLPPLITLLPMRALRSHWHHQKAVSRRSTQKVMSLVHKLNRHVASMATKRLRQYWLLPSASIQFRRMRLTLFSILAVTVRCGIWPTTKTQLH